MLQNTCIMYIALHTTLQYLCYCCAPHHEYPLRALDKYVIDVHIVIHICVVETEQAEYTPTMQYIFSTLSVQGRSVASSRPLRPAKRKRVEDGSGCNANSSTDNQTKASQIGIYMYLEEEIS